MHDSYVPRTSMLTSSSVCPYILASKSLRLPADLKPLYGTKTNHNITIYARLNFVFPDMQRTRYYGIVCLESHEM
jgi:hypothetical protein